ncbi:MarR family EPS-associated transcriptional regulator [Gammaproteobacteria bacterium]|nr:MarR family EPS-associated transcriptional regulator [Gammaproteobacteria bacterium]|tara:strand:- start:1611 stop:1982 length:372 start_codon:yes stop_codon:yes gene_type:complete
MKKNIIENNHKLTSDDLNILRYLEAEQKVSQRELSNSLNISLGKVNFIIRALIAKGIVKAQNFKNNKNKRAYAYYITKEGVQEKSKLTVKFFQRKMGEYDNLKKELRDLEAEIKKNKEDEDFS